MVHEPVKWIIKGRSRKSVVGFVTNSYANGNNITFRGTAVYTRDPPTKRNNIYNENRTKTWMFLTGLMSFGSFPLRFFYAVLSPSVCVGAPVDGGCVDAFSDDREDVSIPTVRLRLYAVAKTAAQTRTCCGIVVKSVRNVFLAWAKRSRFKTHVPSVLDAKMTEQDQVSRSCFAPRLRTVMHQ